MGLDASYCKTVSKERQLTIFGRQIEMAMDFHKPMVLHPRGDVLKAGF